MGKNSQQCSSSELVSYPQTVIKIKDVWAKNIDCLIVGLLSLDSGVKVKLKWFFKYRIYLLFYLTLKMPRFYFEGNALKPEMFDCFGHFRHDHDFRNKRGFHTIHSYIHCMYGQIVHQLYLNRGQFVKDVRTAMKSYLTILPFLIC